MPVSGLEQHPDPLDRSNVTKNGAHAIAGVKVLKLLAVLLAGFLLLADLDGRMVLGERDVARAPVIGVEEEVPRRRNVRLLGMASVVGRVKSLAEAKRTRVAAIDATDTRVGRADTRSKG